MSVGARSLFVMQGISRKVLVLNADYRAFSVCSIYKAFLLIYMDKAEVVNKAKDVFLRTVDKAYDVPSVIKLREIREYAL